MELGFVSQVLLTVKEFWLAGSCWKLDQPPKCAVFVVHSQSSYNEHSGTSLAMILYYIPQHWMTWTMRLAQPSPSSSESSSPCTNYRTQYICFGERSVTWRVNCFCLHKCCRSAEHFQRFLFFISDFRYPQYFGPDNGWGSKLPNSCKDAMWDSCLLHHFRHHLQPQTWATENRRVFNKDTVQKRQLW